MATYGKLLSRCWLDPDFVALNPQEQQLYFLLLSHPKRNHVGVLPLTLRHWASLTAEVSEDTVRAALMRLAQTRFVVLDWDTEEVLIRTYIRNDGVYLQPQIMKCALKQVFETQSKMLRKVIAEEIQRLDKYETMQDWQVCVAKLIKFPSSQVERLNENPERLNENPEKAPGVGCNVSGVRNAPFTVQRTPSTAHQRAREAGLPVVTDGETFDLATSERGRGNPVTLSASRLVAIAIPDGAVPKAHQTILRIEASKLQTNGESNDDILECLRLWLSKSDLGPKALPMLMSEVYKHRHNGNSLSTVDDKVTGWLHLPDPSQELF